jgi:hypothetical protein
MRFAPALLAALALGLVTGPAGAATLGAYPALSSTDPWSNSEVRLSSWCDGPTQVTVLQGAAVKDTFPALLDVGGSHGNCLAAPSGCGSGANPTFGFLSLQNSELGIALWGIFEDAQASGEHLVFAGKLRGDRWAGFAKLEPAAC